ncbi:MAG: hypothetical protein ACUVUQ_11695 [Thermodesulfovibrionales bacterium]
MKGIKLIRLSQALIVSFLILVLTTFASGQTQKTQGAQKPNQPPVEVLNIIDAINQGKIKVEAKGAGLSNVSVTKDYK